MKKIIFRLFENKINFSLKSQGNSMYPFLLSGDVIYYQKKSFKTYTQGDIVMVEKKGRLMTHRVIYKHANYYITKGDNNTGADGKITPSHLIAKAVKIKRRNKLIYPENIYLFQSTLYFQEIVKLKKAFEKENIGFVILKGLPLHLYFEKIHPRRLYADCDFLIDKTDFEKAEMLFLQNGFKKIITSYSFIHKLLKDKPTEISFVKKINGFPIVFDIHFEPVFLMNQLGRLDALYPQMLIDPMTDEFLRTKKTVKVGSESFYVLDTACLILYLALHFFHHNYRGIFRLELIHKIIRNTKNRKETMNQVQDKIKRYKVQYFVYPVFALLKKYFDTPLSIHFIKSIKPVRGKLIYIKKNILNKNIFEDENRLEAGLNRFKNLFELSSEPLWRKLIIFIKPSVIYSVMWTMWEKVILRWKLFFWRQKHVKVHSRPVLLFQF